MRTHRCSAFLGTVNLLLFVAGPGCQQEPRVELPPPDVSVAYPLEGKVTDAVTFQGRTQAVESVEVRPRVWGYISKINFKDGAEVKKGDVLFEIDSRTYEAELKQAEAKVKSYEAQAKFNEAEYKRNQRLVTTGGVSREDLEKSASQVGVMNANITAAEADAARSRLDLDFCKVIAPIEGRASRTELTVGNLVQAGATGSTLLTTIVKMDPIWANFDVDELTLLNIQKKIREGKLKSARDPDAKIVVELGLANELGYPHLGTIDFVDNKVNASTGTLRVRGVFPNNDYVISPGLFVRIRVPLGEPYTALQITERAIDTDQGQKVVFVVNAENKVVKRDVRLGALNKGLRVIEAGLSPGERVIVDGLQRVRAGLVVKPDLVKMPQLPGAEAEPIKAVEAAPAEHK
jgi:RND family efflux transporter MFP subunit